MVNLERADRKWTAACGDYKLVLRLRPCSGAVTKAALLKSGFLGERAMCKACLLLSNLAMTYYADL